MNTYHWERQGKKRRRDASETRLFRSTEGDKQVAGPTIGTIRGTIVIDYDGKGVVKAQDDVDTLSSKSEKTSAVLDKTARNLALFGGVIAGGFAAATTAAVSFEKRMSAINAVSGATASEMDALSKKALQLGADTKFSASEAALAIEELVKAGVSVSDVLNGAADAAVNLAAAGEIDLPQAATIAANSLNQFNLKASDLNKVVDNIAGAANASAIDVTDFGHSLAQVGAVAHLTGQTFEDTATAIALMGNAGIKGSDAGTSLKTFLSNLIPTTKTAQAAFHQLGLDVGASGNAFIDAQGKFKSLTEIAGVLQHATEGLSEAQKQVALETIFGSDAIRAAAVISNAGAEGFQNLNAEMNKTTAAEVAAKRMDNAAGSIEQLKGSVETLGIQVGSKFIPVLNDVVKHLTSWVNSFGQLDKTTQAVTLSIVGLAGAFALLIAAIIKISQAVKAVQAFVAVVKAMELATKLSTVWTKIATAAQWLWNAAMSANPIGLIIRAIIALIAIFVLLFKKNETFRKVVLAVWDAIKKAVGAVVDWFVQKAWPWLKKVFENIVDVAKWLWGWLVKIFQAIVASAKFYIGIFLKIWEFIAPVVKAVFGLIVSIIKTAWSIISAIFSVIVAVVKFVFGLWWSIVSTVFNAILNLVKAVWGFIGPYIIGSIQFWWNFIKTVWNWLVDATTTVFNFVKGIITAVWGFIGPYVIAAAQGIWDFLVKAWDIISSTTSTVWGGIKNFFTTLWAGIVTIFTGARDRVVAIIDSIKAIVDKIRNFFNQLKAAADQGVGPLIDFVKQIPGKIFDALGNVGSMLYDSGRKLIQGLIDGIKSMADKLKNTAKDLLSGLRNLFPFSPAKEGPFSGRGWTGYSGEALIRDFAKGMDKASDLSFNTALNALDNASVALNPGTTTPGATAPASTVNNAGAVNIGQLSLNGVWDFTDPMATRKMLGTLDAELANYRRGYQ